MFLLYGVFRRILFWGQFFCLWSVLAAPKCDCDVSFNDIQCFTRDSDDLCCAIALIDSSSNVVDYTSGVELIDVCEAFKGTLRNVLCLNIDIFECDFVIEFVRCYRKLFVGGMSFTDVVALNECAKKVFKEPLDSLIKYGAFYSVKKELSDKLIGSRVSIDNIKFGYIFKYTMELFVTELGRVAKEAIVPLVGYSLEEFLPALELLKSKLERSLDLRKNELEKWKNHLKVLLVNKGLTKENDMVDDICRLSVEHYNKQNELKESRLEWFKRAIDVVLTHEEQQSNLIPNELAQLVRLSCDVMLIDEDIGCLLDRMRDQKACISTAINPMSIPIAAKYRSCSR